MCLTTTPRQFRRIYVVVLFVLFVFVCFILCLCLFVLTVYIHQAISTLHQGPLMFLTTTPRQFRRIIGLLTLLENQNHVAKLVAAYLFCLLCFVVCFFFVFLCFFVFFAFFVFFCTFWLLYCFCFLCS